MGTKGRANGGRRVFSPRHLSGALAVCLGLLSASLGVCPGGVDTASALQITEFPIPAEISRPSGIAAGFDGNVWFTEEWIPSKIGRISPEGKITEFPLASTANLDSITAGPDGNMWFTEGNSNVGRITPEGQITEFEVPGLGDRQTGGIAAGPDGNLWFKEVYPNAIGRVTPKGQFTEFSLPEGSGFPIQLAAGPDGNVWFTESEPDRIGRITPEGQITEFPLLNTGVGPGKITTGPDGNLWFTEGGIGRLGRITVSGQVTEYAIPTSNSVPRDITLGPDGNLWFAEWLAGKIGRARVTLGAEVSLSATKTGSGSGTVVSEPAGIDCGKVCAAEFYGVEMVQLIAIPSEGSRFAGWSGGGCSGTETVCKVTMDTAKEVVATFDLAPQLTLSVTKTGSGSGTVVSEPAGIDCGETCSAEFYEGTGLALFAKPAPGSKFVGWEGCDNVGGNTCKVTLGKARTVTAQFDLKAPSRTLIVTKNGTGSGAVFSFPEGINCGEEKCSAEFEEGNEVALVAKPAPGSKFSGWSGGGCTVTENVCKVTMDEAKEVAATFDLLLKLKLTVTKAGSGSGTVFTNPEEINCGKTCEAEFTEGHELALFATPAPGSKFVGWSGGGCSGTETACKITMDEAREVVANFDLIPRLKLTVTKAGSGSGTVVSESGGINCGKACTAEYEEGAGVTLYAESAPGSKFVGWEGCDGASEASCKVALSEERTVTARFDLKAPSKLLSVTKAGSGSGVVFSKPFGIKCAEVCTAEFEEGETVLLSASPSKDSKFSGWSGAGCSGTGVCKVTMDEAKEVTATFDLLLKLKLTVIKAGSGSGTVTSSPEGINCGKACEAEFYEGTGLALFATPAPGSKFVGWSGGGCSGTENACKVTMDEEKKVVATFDPIPQLKLSVAKAGSGSGTVVSEPEGINCGKACEAEYSEGETVQLSAIPSEGSKFVGWKGCDGVSGTTCKVALSKARTVTAHFVLKAPNRTLTVIKAGSGSGTVFSEPGGIKCGEACSAEYEEGETVLLSASPSKDSKFSGWSGAGCSGTGVCKVTMDEAKEVTATFDLLLKLKLTVTKEGSGSGTVVSEPGGINCGKTCEAEFTEGTGLALFATPAPGSKFVGWKGCDNASGTTCKVTLGKARTVTAQFALKTPGKLLSVTRAGSGSGTVTSEPAGINCGKACSAEFEEGETVQLFASVSEGSKFVSWSGGCSGAEKVCKVTMDEAKSVIATFGPESPTGVLLSVIKEGSGSGTVDSSPERIDCGETCEAEFKEGEEIILSASPEPGSRFIGWSGGGCSDPGDCEITMSEAQEVVAIFDLVPQLKLSVAKAGTGSGTVTSLPEGIDCGKVCEAEFEEGTGVVLSVKPATGSEFAGWSGGGCSSTETTCEVTMDEDRLVTATFEPLPPPEFFISVIKEGTGSGTVTSSPEGIDCGETCEAEFEGGEEVMLLATPAPGSKFVEWSGGGCSDTSSCLVTIGGGEEVVAIFDLVPRLTLSVTRVGTGSGTVTSEPEGINCGKVCAAEFDEGEGLALFAKPVPGSKFVGWEGCDGVGGTTCKVTMSKARTVTAIFDLLPKLKLSVVTEGTGSSTVTSSPEGINCGKACSAEYEVGTAVILKASPMAGSSFSAWKGCDVVNGRECKVSMSAAKTIKAKFIAVKSLSVEKAGAGAGSIKSAPSGVNCLTACASAVAEFATGRAVTVTATPSKGSAFVEWGGDCTGSGSCVVTMSAARSVTATFAPIAKKALTVNKSGSGAGTVTSMPSAINCGSTCVTQAATFSEGVHVALTPTPAKGMAFTEWSGACSGSGACEVTMSEAATVGAVFSVVTPPKPVTTVPLTVSKVAGTGSGQVTTTPAGVNCDDSCSATTATFKLGAKVILKATPAAGSAFTKWSGACSGSGACEVTMSEAREVAVEFDAIPKKALTVEKAGGGSGSVKSKPAGIDCGTTCPSIVALYADPAQVVLTAAPDEGSEIVGWTGCDVVDGENQCVVTMSQSRVVIAEFE
jgi:streptogramin lyase